MYYQGKTPETQDGIRYETEISGLDDRLKVCEAQLQFPHYQYES